MKILFDLFPVLLFFAVFKWGESHQDSAQQWVTALFASVSAAGAITAEVAPVMLATGVAVLASCLQILYLLVRRQKVEPALWVSFIIILVFGGATIYFHSETFIKWKPTVLYWTYGVGLLAGQWLFKKNLIRSAMESQIQLPDPVWNALLYSWVGFSVVMGIANILVAQHFSTSAWANFKLISVIGIMPAFLIAQSFYLSKYMKDEQHEPH